MIVVVIILVLLGIVIHLLNDRFYVYYYLILYFFVPFIMSIALQLDEEDNQLLTNYSSIFLIGIFIIELVKNKFRMYNPIALLLFLSLCVYIVVNVIINGAPIGKYILHFMVSFIVPLFCLSNLFYWNPPQGDKLRIFIVFIFLTNLVLAFIQYFADFLVLGFKEDSVTMSSISGTLSGGNGFASFLLLFLLYLLLRENQLPPRIKWILIIAAVVVILLTGVRTYLLCSIIFIPLCLIIKNKEKLNPLTATLVLVMILIPFAIVIRFNNKGHGTNDADTAIQRQVYGLSTFAKGESADERSTMFLSLYVFADYFIEKPILGQWRLYSNESYDLVSPENQNVMDASLAVYLSDIGVIGMLLYILFQIQTLMWGGEGEKRKCTLLLYSYVLLTTYTDIGIFSGSLTCCTFIVCFLLQEENNWDIESQLLEAK